MTSDFPDGGRRILPRFIPPARWMWVLLLVLSAVSLTFTLLLWLVTESVLLFFPLLVTVFCAVGAVKTFKWRKQQLIELSEAEIELQRDSTRWRFVLAGVPLFFALWDALIGDLSGLFLYFYLVVIVLTVTVFFAFGYGVWKRPVFLRASAAENSQKSAAEG